MVGRGQRRHRARRAPVPAPPAAPVAQLFPRGRGGRRRDRFGALVAREVRYWWRDARRRANLITIAVVGIFVPVLVNVGGPVDSAPSRPQRPVAVVVALSMLFVGVLAARHAGQPVRLRRQRVRGERGRRGAGPGRAAGAEVGVLALRLPMLAVIRWCSWRCSAEPDGSGSRRRPVAAYGVGLAVNLLISVSARTRCRRRATRSP